MTQATAATAVPYRLSRLNANRWRTQVTTRFNRIRWQRKQTRLLLVPLSQSPVQDRRFPVINKKKLLLFNRCRFRLYCDLIDQYGVNRRVRFVYGSGAKNSHNLRTHAHYIQKKFALCWGSRWPNGFVPIWMKLNYYFSESAMKHEFRVRTNCTKVPKKQTKTTRK